MSTKPYHIPETEPVLVSEPAVAYRRGKAAHKPAAETSSSSNSWNPNVPFHGTQEEWREHFHRIAEGKFTPLEEANREFEIWRRKFLASRLK